MSDKIHTIIYIDDNNDIVFIETNEKQVNNHLDSLFENYREGEDIRNKEFIIFEGFKVKSFPVAMKAYKWGFRKE